jgi:type IV pilus assembly protein PilA
MKTSTYAQTRGGFTLIEILLAIGILAILATATIIAINPARQFAEARDTQRWSDAHAIVNALYQYAVDHKGVLPADLPTNSDFLEICQTDAPNCDGLLNLSVLTTDSKYLTAMPVDPNCTDSCTNGAYGTGYFVATNASGRVDLQARLAEMETIEIIR